MFVKTDNITNVPSFLFNNEFAWFLFDKSEYFTTL